MKPLRNIVSCAALFLTMFFGVPVSLHAELIRVGVFNMNNPGLSQLDWNQRIETLRRWGRQLFSKADVVILSELGAPGLRDDSYLKTLAEASGLVHPHAAFGPLTWDPMWPDVGIISRYPFASQPVVHGLPSATRILDVTIAIRGALHRFLGTHFEHEGDTAHPQRVRVESVLKVRELVARESKGVIFGGDLNTCPPVPAGQESGAFKNECDGKSAEGAEYNMVTHVMADSFCSAEGAGHCSNKRIDYLFFRGPYKVVSYETCPFDADIKPSDHPYVLVTLEYTAPPPSPRAACPTNERCCGAIIGDRCDGDCQPANQLCH